MNNLVGLWSDGTEGVLKGHNGLLFIILLF